MPPPHHRPSRLPARTSPPRIACPPFDSAARVGLQPAAELRHLQRHDHGRHVPGALSARALGPQALSRAPCMPSLPPRTLFPARTSPPITRAPLSTPAERKLLVRPQQAAHPLRVGGHRGLRLRSLWLELGSGKLRVREAQLESCSGSSLDLRERQQHPFRTLTVWSRLVSATAFVAFELYDAIFFRALQSERVRCVDVLR
jgi:hypothetical protein